MIEKNVKNMTLLIKCIWTSHYASTPKKDSAMLFSLNSSNIKEAKAEAVFNKV